jgi:outer membrane protease
MDAMKRAIIEKIARMISKTPSKQIRDSKLYLKMDNTPHLKITNLEWRIINPKWRINSRGWQIISQGWQIISQEWQIISLG